MKPEVKRIFTKLAENNKDSVKVELNKKDKLQQLYKETQDLWVDATTKAAALNKEYQRVNKANDKIKTQLGINVKEAFSLAREITDAYKMLGEQPPGFINTYVDKISDFRSAIPVSNYATIYSV